MKYFKSLNWVQIISIIIGEPNTKFIIYNLKINICLKMDSGTTPKTAEKVEPEEGENDWLFDSIINFLRSPLWKTPIMSFLDEYCIIFDNEEENKLEYTKIHGDFKKLVEELLGHLLAEMEIT